MSPLKASLPLIADFFIFLREDKKLTSIAIKGYRAAIGQVLTYKGLDLSNCPELTALFRNFDQEIIPRAVNIPRWDISLVLLKLKTTPYEPLDQASDKDVTLKTIFLLALATAKRVSELQGLSYIVSHSLNWQKVVLSMDTAFVAKTQVPGKPSTDPETIEVPALEQVLDKGEEDLLLSPVRALKKISEDN